MSEHSESIPAARPEVTDLGRVVDTYSTVLGPDRLLEFPLTPLDHVDVPVWSTWWTGEDGMPGTGGIGYGPTEQRARVGALGECAEHVCAARALPDPRPEQGSLTAMRHRHGSDGVVDPRLLGLPAGIEFDDDRPLVWSAMTRWGDGAEVWAPSEFVASAGSELPRVEPPGGWLTTPVSNGLGAGTALRQALSHALLEIVQRDGNGLAFRALDRGRVIDVSAVTDDRCREVLDRLRQVGVQVLAKLSATDFGMANINVVGAAPGDDVLSATACGEAVHPDRDVALSKALLEFASARARKQLMHGPLDAVRAIATADYEPVIAAADPAAEEQRVLEAMVRWLGLEEGRWRPLLERSVLRHDSTVAFGDLPTTRIDPAGGDLLADVLARLEGEGFGVLYRDLSAGPGTGVHAVKVLVPGTEVETLAYHRIGARNTLRLLEDDRLDVVRVGTAPDGWSAIHLTADGRERVGGPAWLDTDALDAAVGPLLPLYREPSRHTAQKVLAERGATAAGPS